MGSIASNHPLVLLFPFMAKGHTIPLLQFARFLLRRDLTVTVITTPANRPFVVESLRDTTASIVDIPFPDEIPDIPSGIESTDKLPSTSLFHKFAAATARMQAHFERLLEALPRVSFMVTDGFLWWTLESASKFGVPRMVFYGMSNYAVALRREATKSGILRGPQHEDELVTLTRFPWIRLSKNDFDSVFKSPEPQSLTFEFQMNVVSATAKSYGMIVNSFYELEPVFFDYLNEESAPKPWCVGPFCANIVAEPELQPRKPGTWIGWLDQKVEEKCSVLYVAFGSQAEISTEKIREIAIGLERSRVNFLWVIRKKEWGLPDGFIERVGNRGMVVREWVDQREILMHEGVKGFLSHCGWNSVLESICAGVPILAWPLMAEQFLNARMVEEEIKVGFRVETCNGSVRGFVKWEGLTKLARELMEGDSDKGKQVRNKVKQLAAVANKAVQDGGSSYQALDLLINQICNCRYNEERGRR
ncbi:hypothetical protein L6164_005166 [Bauhinia variegata]|uniref:Uncharacterized protein n=1 Tax=Bauhinia variegata TaxID=167791 RepID=A0ACB9PQX7_BAUVA|nr:hypothetical protein L6164_005166 [Bauhinia variegata]